MPNQRSPMTSLGIKYQVCIVLLFVWAILVSNVNPVYSQTPKFLADERSEECFKILGINTLALVTSNPADTAKEIAEAAAARAQEIETTINNIKGDYLLALEFDNLSVYESTYLEAAWNESFDLSIRLEEIKKEIECWKHFENMFRLAELERPPAPPNTGELDKESEPPVDPDPIGTGEVFELAKEYFDRRAEDVAELEQRIKDNAENISTELESRRQAEKIAAQTTSSNQQPSIRTRSARTTVDTPDDMTLVLGGLRFFAGGSLSPGDNGGFSSNPGNQMINFDGNTGWRLRGGAVLPISPNFAIGAGIIYDHASNDLSRLSNPNGTSIAIGGDANIHSVAAEFMLLARLPGNLTGRISGYAGRAYRDIDLRIGGVQALNFTDTVGLTGIGLGIGVPATKLGLNLPRVCFNGGVDYMRYGSANGLSPTGVPIKLGEVDQIIFFAGVTWLLDDSVPNLESSGTSIYCP